MLPSFFTYHAHKHQVQRQRNVPYVDNGLAKHRLDVYLPKTGRNGSGYPIVHFFHGGYWTSGDKNYHQWLTGLYGNIGVALARRGIGVVISNYRLRLPIDDQLADAAAAVNWTADNLKPKKLFVMGHSAGGHIAGLLAASPELRTRHNVSAALAGYIGLSPILDIPDLMANSSQQDREQRYFPIFGTNAAAWPDYSPRQQILAHPTTTPLLIAHGSKDYGNIARQTAAAASEWPATGLALTSLLADGYKHSTMVTRFGAKHDPLLPAVVEFVFKV